MASDRENELLLRRQLLLVRSAELRIALALQVEPLSAPLVLADRIRGAWQWLRAHPEVPLGAAALLVVVRPARAVQWATRLWWAWGLWQRARRLLLAPPP